MAASFLIVSGEPVYELDLPSARPSGRAEDPTRAQMLLHAALDQVDLALTVSPSPFLRVVERHADQVVSAYILQSGLRLLLLHACPSEDGVRAFFGEAHDLYTRAAMNPFYTPGTRLEHTGMDARVRALGKKYLGTG